MLTRLLVEGCGRFMVVGEAEDGQQAIEMAGVLAPDLTLLDLNMPRMNGAQALPGLRKASPSPRSMCSRPCGTPRACIRPKGPARTGSWTSCFPTTA